MDGKTCFTMALIFSCLVGSNGIPYSGDHASVEELVRYYHRLCYTSLQICGFLLYVHGVFLSLSMLKRLKRRLNLRRRNNQTPLHIVVRTIIDLHAGGMSDHGYKSMWRLLNVQCGLCVTQSRVMLCLRAIDHQGVTARSHRCLRMRVYYNKDSRRILWLIASPSNNNPRFVANWYLQWIKKIKRLPRVIRTDAGTENVIMRDLQRALRFNQADNMSGRKSFLIGKSSANQRIERLWGSLKNVFTQLWRNCFQDFQDTGILNTSCPLHIECVRYCFLPVIQQQLDIFVENWNSHRIRRQREEVVSPCGIPDMLNYQPEIFEARDYSLPLPCSLRTIDNLMTEYTNTFLERDCSVEFVNIVELLSGIRREHISKLKCYLEQ